MDVKSATPSRTESTNSIPREEKKLPLVPTLNDETPRADSPTLVIPLKHRLIAFGLILLFATGSSFAESVLPPLKSTLKAELKINNAQYGVITAASNLVNTILPIIGGIGMDHWGATYAAIISRAIVSGAAANTNHYQLLIAGRVIMGLGSTIIEGTQNKLYAHWFRGSWLAFMFGLDIAWSRITTIVAKATAAPMSEINGWWGWALCDHLCSQFCPGTDLLVIRASRSSPVSATSGQGRLCGGAENWSKRRFGLKTLCQLPMFFWIFCATQVLQNGAVGVYTSNLPDIQTVTRGTSKLAAGYNSSLQGIIPIVLTPVVGAFFDRYGWRMIFVSWTALLYIVVFVLIGFTTVHPLAPILISSFALSSNALTFIASIPVLVGDDALLGTAFGVWKAFQNTNSTILEVAAGAIQDRSKDNSYENVMYLIIGIKAVEVILGPTYDVLDGRWLGHSLRMPEKKRLQFRKEAKAEGERWTGWRVSRKVFAIVISQLSTMIVVAWVLYIVYSLPR